MSEIIYRIISDSRAALLSVFISLAFLATMVLGGLSELRHLPDETVKYQPIVMDSKSIKLAPDSIANLHLFGVVPVESQQIPKTTLALTLEGVLLSADSTHSSAIIAPKNGVSAVYSIGERLPNGATVEQIMEDCVVLKFQGRLEKLPLDRAMALMQAGPVSTLR